MEQAKGRLHSVETFGSVDGPGVRFVAFLQGCRLRCQYCHNPDTWAADGEARTVTADELRQALRYRPYWGKDGGITVSGGEPLLQIDFLLEFFAAAKRAGVHTALDTAGQPFTREAPFFGKFERLMGLTDLVLLDLKHIDPAAHRALTGQDNANILDLARYLDAIGKPVWVRHVLVPGRTDDDAALARLAGFLHTLHNVQRVEVLPYHTLGVYKWKALGVAYPLEGIEPPTAARVEHAKRVLGA